MWDGIQRGINAGYGPAHADIADRTGGRIQLFICGWCPAGAYVTVSLTDEPGSREIAAVDGFKTEQGMPYVAVFIGPPPEKSAAVNHKK